MTIKEALSVIKDAKEIRLSNFDGNVQCFDFTDPLILDAFGNYIVDDIYACGEAVFEISIKLTPAKKEDNR